MNFFEYFLENKYFCQGKEYLTNHRTAYVENNTLKVYVYIRIYVYNIIYQAETTACTYVYPRNVIHAQWRVTY
jgi:hypothetical protein